MRDGAARARSRQQGRKGIVYLERIGTLDADRLRLVRSPAHGRNRSCGLSGRLQESQASTVQFSGGITGKDAGQLCISSPGLSLWGLSQDPYWVLLGSLLGLRADTSSTLMQHLSLPALPPSPTLTPRAHKVEGAPPAACHLTLPSRLVKTGPWGAGTFFCSSQGHLSE